MPSRRRRSTGGELLGANSHRHARHDKDRTVLSCLLWRCELSRPDRQTGAFCVWSVSECVERRSATAGRTRAQNAFVGRPIHTARHDRQHCLVVSGGWCELGINCGSLSNSHGELTCVDGKLTSQSATWHVGEVSRKRFDEVLLTCYTCYLRLMGYVAGQLRMPIYIYIYIYIYI